MDVGTKGNDMTQETVLALADKAGLLHPIGGLPDALHRRARLVEFAQLVADAERERIAVFWAGCITEAAGHGEVDIGESILTGRFALTPNV